MRFLPDEREFDPKAELCRITSSESIKQIIDECYNSCMGKGGFDLALINHADMMARQLHQSAKRRTGGSYHHSHIKPVTDKVLQYAADVRNRFPSSKSYCLPVHVIIATIFHDYVEDHSAVERKLQSLALIHDETERKMVLDSITSERKRIIETIYNSFENVFEGVGWKEYNGAETLKLALSRVNNLTRYDEKVDFHESIYKLFGEIVPELDSPYIMQQDTDSARLERALIKLSDRVINQKDYRRAYSYEEVSKLEEYVMQGDESAAISADNFKHVDFNGVDSDYSDVTYQTWKSFIVLNALQSQLVPDIYSKILPKGDESDSQLVNMVMVARRDLINSIDSTLDEMISEFKSAHDDVVYKGTTYSIDDFEKKVDNSISSYKSEGGRYEVNGFALEGDIENVPRKITKRWCDLSTHLKGERKSYDSPEKIAELFVYWKNMKMMNKYFANDQHFSIAGLSGKIEPILDPTKALEEYSGGS